MRKSIPLYPKYTADQFGNIYYNDKLKRYRVHKGYYEIRVKHKGKQLYLRVHRLIAMTFLDNPSNYPMINHIDCNKLNNDISNLEWCNHLHNMEHAYKHGLIKGSTRKASNI